MLAVGACVALAGCFHQVVETGLPAGGATITKGWAPSYVFGLVAGQPIDVRSECPSGVAYVSTRVTFLNGLVGGLTLGLFTPHEVKVTCASRGAAVPSDAVRVGEGSEAMAAAVRDAVATSITTDRPVALVFAPAATR
ncbi:MAG: hypothetical protein MUE41_09540 [Gemmatimonadaceae bacterium]|nr:hypothetical protein [Gemmatimonadaceae bacterium]